MKCWSFTLLAQWPFCVANDQWLLCPSPHLFWMGAFIDRVLFLPVWWAEGQASVCRKRQGAIVFSLDSRQGGATTGSDGAGTRVNIEWMSRLCPLGEKESLNVGYKWEGGDKSTFDYQCPCVPSLFWPVRLARTMWLLLDSVQGRAWSPPLLGWSLGEKFQDRLFLLIPQGHWQQHLGVIVQPLDGNSWIAESLPGKQLQTLQREK